MRRYIIVTLVVLMTSPAAAQTLETGVTLTAGSGLEIGNGGGNEAISRRTPLFFDLGARMWSDEEPDLGWGGSLRVEVEGRASVGIVPQVDMTRRLGPIYLRPAAALPLFFAPFTMMGVEVSITARLPLSNGIGLIASMMADAFFLGSDVPDDSAVLMFNGAMGVELGI